MQKWNRHPYTEWECFKNGMYNTSLDSLEMQEKAIQCFLNTELFNNFCFEVINNWKNSCEEHLNNPSLNKIAYMGQCALCYGFNIPEITTKKAWSFIDEKQKEILNKIALKNIKIYEENSRKLYRKMERNLFGRHTR